MSITLSTSAMIAELQRRVPIGIPTSVCLDRLNEAYRWICQQGSFVWLLKTATVSVAHTTGTFPLPADFDPGRPAYLSYNKLEIPFKPYDIAIKHQIYNSTMSVGQFSVWTFYTTFLGTPPVYTYTGLMFPAESWPISPITISVPLIYHTATGAAIATGTNLYYPTPDSFDSFLVDMAESELRRTYGLAGFEQLIQKAQGSISMMLDAYRSTKPTMMGLMDQERQTKESQAAKAE